MISFSCSGFRGWDRTGINLSFDIKSKEKIDSFDLKNIEIGISQQFYVTNLKIPSDTAKIKLEIIYAGKEFKKDNNIAELVV